ncbi:MAG: HAMP domain-containing sensor histidine kinase, partial [Pseudomonadota bacterium]
TAKGAEQRAWIYETERGGQTLNQRAAFFVEQLSVMRGKTPGDQDAARAFLHDLDATDQFLVWLDDAVHDLEAQAVADVTVMRRLSHLGLIAALLILILEARFIFWPAERIVAKSLHDMMASLDAAEAAQDKVKRILKARTAFFANMSEDLQSPLRILRAYVDQILATDLPGSVVRQLDLVQRASEQMEQIINDVMDVRLLEEGLVEIEEEPLELKELVETKTKSYRQKAERKSVEFKVEIASALPDWVWADPKRLGQIIDNLASNAVKFTHQGSITIRIGTFRNGNFALEVVDTGDGISFTSQDELFRRFVKKPGEPGRSTGGTGLGLPICHDLARLMGGQLSVDSVAGYGSTFRVVLPLKPADMPQAAPQRMKAAVVAA